jgi:DNA-binding NarL/FixJ family response regulator
MSERQNEIPVRTFVHGDQAAAAGIKKEFSDVIEAVQNDSPDLQLAIVHLASVRKEDLAAIVDIKQQSPDTRILVMIDPGLLSDPNVDIALIKAGTDGVVSSQFATTEEWISATKQMIQVVSQYGGYYRSPGLPPLYLSDKSISPSQQLTSREMETLQYFAQNMSVAEISQILGISQSTVKSHKGRVFAKLGVDSVQGALRVASEHGLL